MTNPEGKTNDQIVTYSSHQINVMWGKKKKTHEEA